jgi:ATP-dependent helicase/nuclease subunit B
MLYRNVAENLAYINLPARPYYIVGFTQLSAAEANIVKRILDTQKGEYLVDTDAYYINDKLMTAGISYRKNFKRLGIKEPKFIEENITNQKKEINIYPCNGKQEQVQTVYSLIQQLDLSTEKHTDTAILLPDPTMLQPLIAQLPERYKDANISMGLSMANASIYRLLSSLQQCLHYAKSFHEEPCFYLKSLIKLVENPLLQAHQNLLGELIKMSEKSVYISIKNVAQKLAKDDKFSTLLSPISSTTTFGESLYHFVSSLNTKDEVGQYYINTTKELISNVNLKAEISSLLSIDDYLMLLLDQISSSEIPFDVNPKTGLQIMGIRESRNLDFKNVFILSMNEGVFPSSSKGNSYIPIEIRMAYLTPPIEKDAISSYLFYRLLHRSEKIFLLYNQQVKVSGGGELSRFIVQTKIALKQLKNIEIKEWEVKSNWVTPKKPETIIEKNEVNSSTSQTPTC